MQCGHDGCSKPVEPGRDECYRHRIMSVGLTLRAPAQAGQWHTTANDWRAEHLGSTDERELGRRGIERAT